ncbi:MAG: GAF domain-containing protein [candidate division NC10 bacterium]|nr:GAF domain-containing protein [candidate division NC10 bacterium]
MAEHGPRVAGPGDRARLRILLEVIKAMSAETDFERLLQLIMEETTRAMEADRSTLFLVDHERGELWSRIALGLKERKEIRFKSHLGIAGHVATTGEPLNIPEAYEDPRFNQEVDRQTGYRTRTILCMPVRNKAGSIVGALQVLNKRAGVFTPADEEMLDALASQAAIALENAKLYEDLRKAYEELKQLDAMKGNFLANISHELRTPLAPIIGYVEMLLSARPGPLTDRQRSHLQVVEQAVQRLQGLIEDLLAFVQMEQGELLLQTRPFAIAALLEERARVLTPRATEKGLTVEVAVPSGLPDVQVDPKQISRALMLLLDNAIKFTPPGGRIALGAKAHVAPDDAPPGWPHGYVEVSLSDTGIGIPADKIPRIFEKFYQVDASTTRSYGGTGLGLALVKQIMEAHGTRLAVESTPGVGSTFRLRLPIAHPYA